MSLISSAIRNGSTKLLPLFTKPKHVLRKRLEVPRNIFRHSLDPYFDCCPTSKMKTLSKKVSEFQLLTIFAKSLPNGFLSLFWIRLFYQKLQKKIRAQLFFQGKLFLRAFQRSGLLWKTISDKVLKNGTSKISDKQPLENMVQCRLGKIRISAVNVNYC